MDIEDREKELERRKQIKQIKQENKKKISPNVLEMLKSGDLAKKAHGIKKTQSHFDNHTNNPVVSSIFGFNYNVNMGNRNCIFYLNLDIT